MPVPGGGFEAEMLARREIALVRADQAHDQEQRADDDVEAVEARRHEERRAIVQAFERKRGVRIFIRLDRAEQHAADERQPPALWHAIPVADPEQAPKAGPVAAALAAARTSGG